MAIASGHRLGPYQIVEPIGSGGMGAVYLATDTRMGRFVAIKLVPERFLARFDREVRAIAALNHPNICIIHDVGPNYLVMEYVSGAQLKGPVPEAKALELAAQIAAALEAAHTRGIVHRDLKPANILVTSDGLKLLDFGVASMALPPGSEHIGTAPPGIPGPGETGEYPPSQDSSSADLDTKTFSSGITVPGVALGTPAYMSPEQATGSTCDARSDIFSFGVVVYELLTGRRPFQGETMEALLLATLQKEPAPLEASTEVSHLVAKCLRKNPADRFQSISEVRVALQRAKSPLIAVLPFTVLGAGQAAEYFGAGLTEDVISALSGVKGLRVMARTSTSAFKDRAHDVRTFAQSLGVDHLLEGSVRTDGERIRITVQLFATQDGAQLWTRRYDRNLTDVFAIQDEISNAIARELTLTLGHEKLVKRPTAHFAAYEAVLQGRYHFDRFDPADLSKAIVCFERALAIDPEYAAAHIGVSLFYWSQMVLGLADPREAMQRSFVAVKQALRIDPHSSEGNHILASYYAVHDRDWVKAEQLFSRAIELNPNSTWAYHCRTNYVLVTLGRYEEALAVQDKALALDPLALPVLWARSLILECLKRKEDENQSIERINQMDPRFPAGQWLLVRLRVRQGRFSEAIEIAERLVNNNGRWGMTLGTLGTAYAGAGQVEAAQGVLAELALDHNRESGPFFSALIAAAMGDHEGAYRFAAQSIERHMPLMHILIRSSSFEFMHGDPRYDNLLRMINAVQPRAVSTRQSV